jgi:hypothetical protein
VWNLGSPDATQWLVSGYGPAQPVAKGAPVSFQRWSREPTARALVPLLMPDGVRATWWLSPSTPGEHVTIRWNGETVADQDLAAGWNAVELVVPEDVVRVGTNTIAIDAPLGADGNGVAIARMDLRFR